MNCAPIALFTYNRPRHVSQVISALQKNLLASNSDLFIFSDAPKNKFEVEAVLAVRQYIETVNGFKSINVVKREKNCGLAHSIIDGVTSIVNKYGRIIVLEDDLIVTKNYLEFMNRALDKYENEEKIIQISGFMFPVELDSDEDSVFLPLITSWGWATWKSAWQLFDADAKGYEKVNSDIELRNRFNLNGAYDFYSMLQDQLAGKIDSWAICWQLSTFLYGGLTLYPTQSLVMNAGFDGSGTHRYEQGLLSRSSINENFVPDTFPGSIVVGPAWIKVKSCLRSRLSWKNRIKNLLRNIFLPG